MNLILVTLLIAVLGCRAQQDGSPSSSLRQRNRGSSDERSDSASGRRAMQKRDEMDGNSMYHNCFVMKGCFGYPAGCIQRRDCEVLLSFVNGEGGITFILNGYVEQDNYMAMGLSMDSQMGDDAVTECFRQGSNVLVRESWNNGKSNADTTEVPRQFYHSDYKEGLTTCAWTETYLKEAGGRRFNLQNNTYYLLLAKGPMRNGRIGYHSGRLASQEAVNFTAFDTISGEGVSDSVKIHGDEESTVKSEMTDMPTDDHDHDHSGSTKKSSDHSAGSKPSFSYSLVLVALAALRFSRPLKP